MNEENFKGVVAGIEDAIAFVQGDEARAGAPCYTAIVERAEDGFGVFFPDLPGCVSGGDTVQDALANAEAVLALHLAGMREDGDPLPKPSAPDAIKADPEVDEIGRYAVQGVRTRPTTDGAAAAPPPRRAPRSAE